MKKLSKISLLTVFLCCWLMGSTTAEAKVCFAGDGDCGGIETFGGYDDPSENLKDQCAAAGYETLRSECTASAGKQITDHCPYDSNYVKCCSLEYQYDACVYPMVQAGKCGNKYKCVCDSSKYKYTAEQCRSLFPNSNAAGASCAQVEYNAGSMSTSTKILFTECACNEALYPYEAKDCTFGTAPTGRTCSQVSSNGEKSLKYESCLCNRDIYQYTVNQCSNETNDNWGGDDARKCVQGGNTYFANCLHCKPGGYVSESLEHVDGVACQKLQNVGLTPVDPGDITFGKLSNSAVQSELAFNRTDDNFIGTIGGVRDDQQSDSSLSNIEVIGGVVYQKPSASAKCGYAQCPYGPRYKILRCKPGYEVKNGVCTVKSCKDIVREFVKQYPEYALLDDVTKDTDAINVIVAGDTTINATSCSTSSHKVCTSCTCSTSSSQQCYRVDRGCDISCGGRDELLPSITGPDDNVDIREPGIKEPIGYIKEPITTSSFPCCTAYKTEYDTVQGKGLKCGRGLKYVSAARLVEKNAIAGTLVDAMKEACTITPTVTITGSSFPYDNAGNTGSMIFEGVNLDFKYTANVLRDITIKSGNLNAASLTFKRNAILDSESRTGFKVKSTGTITFESNVNSKGYDYDFYKIKALNTGATRTFQGLTNSNRMKFTGKMFISAGTTNMSMITADVNQTFVGHNPEKDSSMTENIARSYGFSSLYLSKATWNVAHTTGNNYIALGWKAYMGRSEDTNDSDAFLLFYGGYKKRYCINYGKGKGARQLNLNGDEHPYICKMTENLSRESYHIWYGCGECSNRVRGSCSGNKFIHCYE